MLISRCYFTAYNSKENAVSIFLLPLKFPNETLVAKDPFSAFFGLFYGFLGGFGVLNRIIILKKIVKNHIKMIIIPPFFHTLRRVFYSFLIRHLLYLLLHILTWWRFGIFHHQ